MSQEITVAMKKAYADTVRHAIQQKRSILRNAVMEEAHRGEEVFFDSLGVAKARKKTGRGEPTKHDNTPHRRRKLMTNDYVYSDLVSGFDVLRTMSDPTNAYVKASEMAMKRAMDEEIINAGFATAWTGKNGTVQLPFPSTQVIDAAGTGLTLDKVLEARRMFIANKLIEDTGNPAGDEEARAYMLIGTKQWKEFINSTEVKSFDYNSQKALTSGRINEFLGFQFIVSDSTLVDSGGDRRCMAWTKESILLSPTKEPETDISKRPDLDNEIQVWMGMTIGAIRMEELGVIEIDCVEA